MACSGEGAHVPVSSDAGTGSIFIEDSGRKDLQSTLLCFPGIGDVRSSFRMLVAQLQDSCRVVIADLRGMGDSRGRFAQYTPEVVADDFRAVLRHLCARDGSVILVANSLAAGSAMLVAAEGHPAVCGVVLLCPIMRDMPMDRYFRPMSHVLFAWPWGSWLWRTYYRSLYKRDQHPEGFDDHVCAIKTSLRGPGVRASVGKFLRATKRGVENSLVKVRLLVPPPFPPSSTLPT